MTIENRSKIGIGTGDWTPVAGAPLNDVERAGFAWHYNWLASPLKDIDADPESSSFIPMIWDETYVTARSLASAKFSGSSTLLGFNEPDHPDQARMTVDQALALWPQLEATGMRLGSPAATQYETLGAGSWLGRFMTGAESKGLKVDFITTHYYSTDKDVGNFERWLEAVHAQYNKPIWVTEWALADWANPSRFSAVEQAEFARAGTEMMDDLSFVEKHAWFAAYDGGDGWNLNSGVFDASGALTAVGEVFSKMNRPTLSASDSGVAGDRITGDATPTLAGTAGAGSTVAVFDDALLLGTVLVGSTGQWSFTPGTALADGVHTLTTTQTDATGNVSAASAALALTIDTFVPVPAVDGQIPHGNTRTISGKATPGSTVALLTNGVAVGSVVADAATGTFEVAPDTPLALGLNRLTTTQTTARGTSAPSVPVVLFVVQAPEQGISTTGFSSADIGGALDLGASLAFIGGTEAVLLIDATLSVGTNTNQATLQRLYQGLLGRGNDTAGIIHWDDQLNHGVSKAVVAAGLLTTDEYAAAHPVQTDEQFVTNLYQGLLGRTPEQGSLAAWTEAMAQGASRGEVVISIADSGEAKSHLAPATARVYVPNDAGTLTHMLYETGLGREVELPASAYWKAAYNVLTPLQLAASIASSLEFTASHAGQNNDAYVNSLYQAGLGRPAEASGMASWTSLLSNGEATRTDVLLAVATSDEAHAHLTYNLSGAPNS